MTASLASLVFFIEFVSVDPLTFLSRKWFLFLSQSAGGQGSGVSCSVNPPKADDEEANVSRQRR